jgi:hypothetical protein
MAAEKWTKRGTGGWPASELTMAEKCEISLLYFSLPFDGVRQVATQKNGLCDDDRQLPSEQGDQIGRNFNFWAVGYLGQFF